MLMSAELKRYVAWCKCNNAYKSDEFLNIKNCYCKERLVGKIMLECEDEILNTNETLLNDEKGIALVTLFH